MSRAYEKRLQRLKQSQDATGTTPIDNTPMHRGSREAFVRGFGLSAAATKQLVDKWEADVAAHYHLGHAEGVEWAEEQQ